VGEVLTVYVVSLTTVGNLEALIRSYIRRVRLYSKGILKQPVSALTEEFKCAKVRLEMTLVESHDKCVREAAPVLNKLVESSQQRNLWKRQRLPFKLGMSWDKYSMEKWVLGSVLLLLNGTRQAQFKGGSW